MKANQGPALLEALEQSVAEALRRRGDVLEARQRTGWVAFRSRQLQRVFAEVRAHRGDVEAFILPAPHELPRANGLARAAPPTQGWGWFQSKFRVREATALDDATELLLASYRRRWEMGRHRTQSHK